ncbi:methyl-accepting chemotaxis protein [Hydrogenophaga sp.]|uniref:methyl-accepting chemotaxis protein n=1 Tax=Hydrogenophaga sp. TaxID=1904254 RepID=UPI002730C855|nr:methyl-accepting chemotaxis protein [Hydrogenophaga sp.]MDP2075689.1 methyl-accepting chemotaxis protein [Hydrogenophaga sp.]MDP3108640.1 methyl-accepting chemotaxis protein [Hydrogenophaga sp.]MDP3350273.1 methyl-accepting chemotaxis protein [Hydrogenophaga sp.]MDZ4282285.1 methyl-accepting chemotaxis protein [Hydrogenophaga sp.]
MQTGLNFGIARRLYAVSALITLALAGLAAFAFTSLADVSDRAHFTQTVRVPQLEASGELELNVTRVSLQVRHAILARNEQELNAALQYIGDKQKHMNEVLASYEKRLFSPQGKEHFKTLPPLLDEFWKVGGANIALIKEGKKEEAFAFLVDNTIPARDRLLKGLSDGHKIQQTGLEADIGQVEASISTTSNLLVAAVVLIALLLVGFSWYVGRLLSRRVAVTQAVAERVRDGDLTVPVVDDSRDEFTPLLATMKEMQNSLTGVVSNVRQGADSVAIASAQIAQGNNDLSARTEQQASALEETSASMEQMGSTASQNADNARQASQLAASASSVAVQGGDVVNQVVQTMKDINDSSRKISDIIGTIDGIAFQTNILALNAAVEAARAGEQGRGFAVVAGEVRNLAQRSAEAAKEIKRLISASVERVEQGTALVDQAGSTMQEIVQSIQRVSDIVGEISSASQEQNAGVNQVSEAVSNMDQTTQQNAALVEESAAAASGLQSQAQQLVQAVGVFRLPGGAQASAPVSVAPPVPRAHPAVPPFAKPVSRPAVKPATSKPVATPKAVPAGAGAGDDWESF